MFDNKGKKNVYLCDKCGHGFVSVDLHAGTTPFLMSCQQADCNNLATSLCYKIPQAILERITPVVEWYQPDAVEQAKLDPATLRHVAMGGLLCREAKPGGSA